MQLSLDKLQKFFKLEAERGFDNRAVVGGLDKILVSWEAQARIDNLTENKIQTVIKQIKKYPQLDVDARSTVLKELWHLLQLPHEDNSAILESPVIEKVDTPSQIKSKPSNDETPPNPILQQQIRERKTINLLELQTTKRSSSVRLNHVPEHRDSDKTGLNASLSVISGVGFKHAQSLANLNLQNIEDLIYFFPRRYDDYSQLKTISQLNYGEEGTIIANIQSISERVIGTNKHITEVVVNDGTGSLRLNWFNQPWQANHLKVGFPISISGKIEQFLGRPMMTNPECETINQEQLNTNRIVPVYSLSGNLTQHWVRRVMYQTINYWGPRIIDYLPEDIKKTANLIDLPGALLECHFPSSQELLKAAQDRLAFDEIFLLQLGVMRQKQTLRATIARKFIFSDDQVETLFSLVPFQLTKAQQNAIRDIRNDLESGFPMNRLLQGDVGSGKTIVAALGIAMVTCQGAQAALMAPTSILAEQHFRSLSHWLCNEDNVDASWLKPGEIRLLTGSTPENEKQEIREKLESGGIKLLIGTHALIEDPVKFHDLQFIVVDEQHRFGVEQRALLRSKGKNPHILVMTATPIPRSLALTIYGDLDLTIIDELPAGRQVVSTYVLDPRERERAYALIRSQINNNYQAFIIYPLIEKGENDEEHAAIEEYKRLQKEIFTNQKIGLLHGRMKPEEKEQVMKGFRDGEFQILVSTSVVEVGVDIPNATVMIVEGANRFGLAQLHQFRGRVGRGSAKSYCLLIPETGNGSENQRLVVMTETNDGFILAQKDLDLRGPGEFLGTHQSGYPELKMANITDIYLIEKARTCAQSLFERDPDIQASENQPLFQKMQAFWSKHKGEIS